VLNINFEDQNKKTLKFQGPSCKKAKTSTSQVNSFSRRYSDVNSGSISEASMKPVLISL